MSTQVKEAGKTARALKCKGAMQLEAIREILGLNQIEMAKILGVGQSTYSELERQGDRLAFERTMKCGKYRRTQNLQSILDFEVPISKLSKHLMGLDVSEYKDLSIDGLAVLLDVYIDWSDEYDSNREIRPPPGLKHMTRHALSQFSGDNQVRIVVPEQLKYLSRNSWITAELKALGTIVLPKSIKITEAVVATVVPDDQLESWRGAGLKKGDLLLLTRFKGEIQEGGLYVIHTRGEAYIRTAVKVGKHWRFASSHWDKRKHR